jgi:hypothetical protein
MALAAFVTVAGAQPFGRGEGPGMGPGMMMGPGIGGPGGFGRICGPGASGFMEWRIARLEQALKLTEAQKQKLDEFKSASAKAAEAMRSTCPAAFPATLPARMELMEKRSEAMLQAVRTVRPALDGFYASLTEEQKALVNSARGHHRFWRWRDRW